MSYTVRFSRLSSDGREFFTSRGFRTKGDAVEFLRRDGYVAVDEATGKKRLPNIFYDGETIATIL